MNVIELSEQLKRIKQMKSTARIINVARGGIINENDLSLALNSDIIAGAAVDVFVEEPLDSQHPFMTTKNLLITPHLGASTIESKEGVSQVISQQIKDILLNQNYQMFLISQLLTCLFLNKLNHI